MVEPERETYNVERSNKPESTLKRGDSKDDLQGVYESKDRYHLAKLAEWEDGDEKFVRFRILSSPYNRLLTRGMDVVLPREDYDEIILPFGSKEEGLESISADTFLAKNPKVVSAFGNMIRAYFPLVLKATVEEYLDYRKAKDREVESREINEELDE